MLTWSGLRSCSVRGAQRQMPGLTGVRWGLTSLALLAERWKLLLHSAALVLSVAKTKVPSTSTPTIARQGRSTDTPCTSLCCAIGLSLSMLFVLYCAVLCYAVLRWHECSFRAQSLSSLTRSISPALASNFSATPLPPSLLPSLPPVVSSVLIPSSWFSMDVPLLPSPPRK